MTAKKQQNIAYTAHTSNMYPKLGRHQVPSSGILGKILIGRPQGRKSFGHRSRPRQGVCKRSGASKTRVKRGSCDQHAVAHGHDRRKILQEKNLKQKKKE